MLNIELTIEVNGGIIRLGKDENGNPAIESQGLKEPCLYCASETCNYNCDESQADGFESDEREHNAERDVWNAAIDGMESMILAMYAEGTVPTKTAIETVLDAIDNHYG